MLDRLTHKRLPPTHEAMPQWLAPVPQQIEEIGYRYLWAIIAINLAGTAFGFWYYRYQLAATPQVMWPFVPDSPTATLLIALAFGLWAFGAPNEYVTVLAFFGNLIFGLWTPWILLVGWEESIAASGVGLHLFLVISHLGMVVQAFILYRIAVFRLRAIAVATGWYTVNLTVDYFLPIIGAEYSGPLFPVRPHHTWIPLARDTVVGAGATGYQLAALGATVGLVLAVFLATSRRVIAATRTSRTTTS